PGVVRATTADVGVGAGVAQGLIGGWAPALGLGGTLGSHRWSARLGGLWLPDRSSAYGPGRVEVGLTLARIALCASTQTGRAGLTLGLCAQQQLGWISGRGIDYQDNHAANQLWLATGASVVAGGPLGPTVGWGVEAGGGRLLSEARYLVRDPGP